MYGFTDLLSRMIRSVFGDWLKLSFGFN